MNGVLIIILCFFVFIFLNVPIAMSIGLSVMTYIFTVGGITPTYFIQSLYTTCGESFSLLAVPFFILAGAFMEGGGLSKRLVNLCDALLGHFTGGMAIVTVVTCMFFGAISGSAPATVAAVGAIVVPAMVERGYSRAFSCALAATSGILGIIIPPSVPMVIYGTSTNASVGEMFLGGFGPGILLTGMLVVFVFVMCHKRGYKGNGEKFSLRKVGKSFVQALGALMVPVIILGGIYSGLFTPTESAAVCVVYGILAGVFIYRELTWKKFMAALESSCITVGSVLIIIGTATAMGRVFTVEQLPQNLATALNAISNNPVVILLLINLILLVVGCFMETAAAITILAPILYPIVAPYGVDIIQFGLIMVINLGIGLITPPVGVNLYVALGLDDKVSFGALIKEVLPLIILMITGLLIVTFVPDIVTFLPDLLGY